MYKFLNYLILIVFFSFCISPNAESLYGNPEENSGTDLSSNEPGSVQINENISNENSTTTSTTTTTSTSTTTTSTSTTTTSTSTTTTSTTTTTLPLPPNIELISCPSTIKIGEEIVYRYAVSAPTSGVTSIKYEIDLNGSSVVDDSIENNNLALPGLAENVSYEYKYTIPSVSESTNVSFTVTATNQRGDESIANCSSSIEIDKSAPDFGTLEVYAGYSYSSSVGDWAPYQSTGYLNGRTFRVRSSLINDDTLKYISFTLTPHEAIGSEFLNCRLDYDSQTVYVSGAEILCVVDYPSSEVKKFVPYNKTSREWQGWYRLDVELVDGSGNAKTIQYCRALRIVGGYQSSWTDTTTYTYYDYSSQLWTEVYRNTGQC